MVSIFRKMWSKKQITEIIKKSIQDGSLIIYKDLDISESLTPATISGISTELDYCRIRVSDDQVLSLVLNFSVENTSEAQITLGNDYSIQWTLPEDIAKKIYDVNGDTINDTLESAAGITAGMSYNDDGNKTAGYRVSRVCVVNNVLTANKAGFYFRDLGNIPAGRKWNFTFRIFLTL